MLSWNARTNTLNVALCISLALSGTVSEVTTSRPLRLLLARGRLSCETADDIPNVVDVNTSGRRFFLFTLMAVAGIFDLLGNMTGHAAVHWSVSSCR